jgi:lipoprotein-releasing system permease protein
MSSGVYELLVGWRYTRARRRNQFVSFISLIAMLGIALGVAALITVMSVMNGFQRELRDRILGMAAHIQLVGEGDRLGDWPALAKQAAGAPGVLATAPYAQAQAMLSVEGGVRGAQVRGIDPVQEEKVAEINRHMIAGRLVDLVAGEFGIVLGAELARALQLRMGDRVTVVAPQGLVTPAGIVPRTKQFRLVGVFEAGMFEFDGALALVHLKDAQRLFRFGHDVSGVRLKVGDIFDAPDVARALAPRLPAGVRASDWTQTHASFFRAVKVEKNVMFVILLLIVAVAAFNIIATLVMAVNDKQADIAILRTLGASPRSIQAIFIVQGALIGLVGTVLGLALGLVVTLNLDAIVSGIERIAGSYLLDPNVYYISRLPTHLLPADVTLIVALSAAIALAATLYPSYRAAAVRPAEALRYE